MLLPTKGVSPDRALITIGSELLEELRDPLSVSALWRRYDSRQREAKTSGRITFDWFSLALATLYAMGLIDMFDDGRVRRTHVSH
ncbi:ABC-three component system middle component 6 [Nocardia suismassiliense]|uniref:ABC-three component system middle component 6 n=1 Tax=Nocardia suismassiliense TaxID=2077092 RepID=UPI000D1DFEA5|nr:ABC-three component system middle component 6 [Nocardia suismassiliense]